MSNLEEVCLLSCESWVDSFPNDIPKHKFSKKHNEKMKEILNPQAIESSRKITKKTFKFLLIAAILLCLATTVFAIPSSRQYVVQKFSNHSKYNVSDTDSSIEFKPLEVNYIPEGFEQYEFTEKSAVYKNQEQYFEVKKCELNSVVEFDTESYDSEKITINGIEAEYFGADNNYNGVVFNNAEGIFIISGNIDKQEIVNIAQNVK